MLIGTKSGTTRTSVTLSTAYHADRTKAIRTAGASKIDLNILYTTGAAETNNSVEVRVKSSPDGVNFYQIPNESVSAGTSTLTAREFTFVGADAATGYGLSLPLDVQNLWMQFEFKESGVSANAGTLYVEAVLSGAR